MPMTPAQTEAVDWANTFARGAGLPTYGELADALRAAQMPLALYRGYGWPDRAGVVRQVDAIIARLPK